MQSVQYRHHRPTSNGQPLPTGGVTIALQRNMNMVTVGIAKCSKHDKYCKQTGRELAYKRMQMPDKRFTITASHVRDFLCYPHITLKGFTPAATTRFINSIQLDDITDELLFKWVLDLSWLLT